MENLIKRIFALKQNIEVKDAEKEKLKKEMETVTADTKVLETELQKLNAELLEKMLQTKTVNADGVVEVKDVTVEDLVATYFCKSEFSYGDETALLKHLKADKDLSKYVKVVTTVKESIDKTALKKDLKADANLKESLKDYVGDRTTEYVVVTTEENHKKMLEHVEENKNKKVIDN